MDIAVETENFIRIALLITDIIPRNLRQLFKDGWNKKFPHIPWTEDAASGQNFMTEIQKKKTQMKDQQVKIKIKNGDTNDWDCTTLFFALLYSNVPIIDAGKKTHVDDIRIVRNKYFGHVTSSQLPKQKFDDIIRDLRQIFTALAFNTNDITDSATKTLETVDFKSLKEQLKAEKERNDEFHGRLGLLERRVDDIEDESRQHSEALSQQAESVFTLQDESRQHSEALSQQAQSVSTLQDESRQHSEALSQQAKSVSTLQDESRQHSEAIADLSQQVKFRRHREFDASAKADALQFSSKMLEEKYKRHFKKHTITCVESKGLDVKDVDLEKFSVDVTVVGQDEIAELPNERSQFIDKMHVIRSQRSVELNEVVDSESEERVSFIRGLAGIGKTVLAKQIALKWANHTILYNFTHLYVFECRKLNNETSLNDLLKREFFAESVPEGSKILFIIDGIDEVVDLETKLKNKNSIIYQLLDKKSDRFVGSKVILTGRPHVQTALKSRQGVDLIGNMKIYEAVGLSEKSINEYIDLFTEKEPEKKMAIQKTVELSPNIRGLMSIPQYLNTLCCVSILTEGKAILNTTELYCWLLFIFFQSHIEDVPYVSDIFSNYFNFIKIFGKISYQLLLKKTIVFNRNDFMEELEELNNDQNIADIFNVFCIDVGGIRGVRKMQFKHLTLQEYFASLYCIIEKIEPKILMKNNCFEIITFMCGFYGGTLETQGQMEESMINIFANELFERNERNGEKEGQKFILDVLNALKDEVEGAYIRFVRLLPFLCEYFDNQLKYDQEFIDSMFQEFIRFMPIDYYHPQGFLHSFGMGTSSITQSNVIKLIEIMENHYLLDELRWVFVDLSLVNFGLCKYFKHFGRVRVNVTSVESVDNLNLLFNHCKYCYIVELCNCKLIGDLKLDLLINQLRDDDDRKMEWLNIINCQFDEKNLLNIIEIVANMKMVQLEMLEMEEEEWERFANFMEQRRGQGAIQLDVLNLRKCNIGDQFVERIKRTGVYVQKHR